MRRLLSAIGLAAALTFATGCSTTPPEFGSFVSVPAEGWAYGDTLSVEPQMTDSANCGRLSLSVRHTDAYAYRNLWLEVITPLADTVQVDTVNVELADRFGKWYGTGVGVSFCVSDTLPGYYCLPRGSRIGVRHIMRLDTLQDIEQIGITLVP